MGSTLAYYIFVLPLSHLPLWCLYRFADFFYILLITVFPYRKTVIESNLKRSFPDKSQKEIKLLRNAFYRHFADILVEGIKNLSISKEELLRRFKVNNPEIMDELFAQNKSVILVSGHYNNWEWLITAQNCLFQHQAMGIGMPMTSKFWDKKVNERRSRFGMKVVHAKNFKDEIKKFTQKPVAILTLGDQSPGDARKSYWMEFLHQQTAVLFGTEQMAHSNDFAVVFFINRKVKRGYYVMQLSLITDNPSSFEWGEITEKHTHLLEKEIITNPAFWVWSHKRWKREVPSDLKQLKKEQHDKFNATFKS
jgi:KDO2-lipid IV(A) lauroyltransferase